MSTDLDFTFDTDELLREAERIADRSTQRQPAGYADGNGRDRGDQPLYLDLETAPDEERIHLFGLDPLPELRPETDISLLPDPADFVGATVDQITSVINNNVPPELWLSQIEEFERRAKKPRSTVLNAIANARASRASEPDRIIDAYQAQRKKMSITPEFCRIVAVGWAVGDERPQSVIAGYELNQARLPWDERRVLVHIWDLIKAASPIVGFNILSFDLAVIRCRSVLLGVPSTKLLSDSPWSNRDVTDLMTSRFGRSIGNGVMGLKRLAKLYGIDVPAGDVDGSQVEKLLADDPGKLEEYVRSDVQITRELHRKWSGYFCV